MKITYCQQIEWNGQFIQIKLLSNEVDYATKEISLWGRKSKQIKLVEYSLNEKDGQLFCEINIDQFRNLKMGKFDFYIKSKHKKNWKRLSLNNSASQFQQTSYFEPIVSINPARSFSLFLSSKSGLSLHCSRADKLEEKTYNIVSYNKQILSLKDEEEAFKIRINTINDLIRHAEAVIKNEFNEFFRVPLKYINGEIILPKEDIDFLKGKWTFYIQQKKGRILEQMHLYIHEEFSQESLSPLKTINYRYFPINEHSTLIIRLKEYNRPSETIKGELIVENLKLVNNQMVFDLASSQDDSSDNWQFYLKRNHSDERLYLKTNQVVEKEKAQIYIGANQFKMIASKNLKWNLYAEKNHVDYMEVRRVGEYHSSLPPKAKRYKGFFEMDEQLCAVPSISKSLTIQIIFMTVDQYYKLTSPAEVSIKSLTMNNGLMKLRLSLGLANKEPFDFKGLKLIQRKEPSQQIELPIEKLNEYQNGKIVITSNIDLTLLNFEPFYWDFFALILINGNESRQIRIYSDNYIVIKKLRHFMYKYTLVNSEQYLTYPYLTVNGGLSITHRKRGEFEGRKNKLIEYSAFIYYNLVYKFLVREPIWLVHEKYSETAQDNGYYFFKYCYTNHHNKKVHYVIKKGTIDELNLKGYEDRIVYFMSFKHLVLLLSSRVIISSEAKGHGYAWRVSQGVIRDYLNAKKFVFLQHGVLGLKKVDNTFDYNTQNSAELFVASSDYEKRIIKKYFGYNDDRIIVTGLPRWDVLEDKSKQFDHKNKEILLMPTWRNWLDEVEEEEFIQSDYFKAYNELLHSEALHTVLQEHSLLLNFYVHPKFMPFVTSFTKANENINIIQFGEAKVNDLLMRSSLLITDYSSVSWEMHYQKKPVLFYHFDVEQYTMYQGSYMDMDKELFGETVYNSEKLVESISNLACSEFSEKERYIKKRNEYFKYIDSNNSERIYHEIVLKEKEINKKRSLFRSIKESDLVKVLWRKYKNVDFIQRFGKKILSALK